MSYAENEKEILRGMAEMFEEFKPFPKDKVNKQIDKAKSDRDNVMDNTDGDREKHDARSHKMTAVKNYRTKVTDRQKSQQKHTGSDHDKTIDQGDKHLADIDKHMDASDKHEKKANKHANKAAKAMDKGKINKFLKHDKKAEKHTDAYHDANYGFSNSIKKANTGLAVNKTIVKGKKSEIDKQAEINKKDKADRAKAKSSLDRSGLESSLKAKPKKEKMKGPKIKNTIKKESMNFSEFLESTVHPLYEKEGEVPKCPPGYKYDQKMQMCVPKTKKDSIGNEQKTSDKDLKPGSGATYNVWGSSGYDGSGYAWEEGPTSNDKAGY